jgi:ketosteroid isomerase-like protein
MKTKIFIVVLFFTFFASCTPKEELTQQDKDQIKKEVSAVFANMVTSYEQLNMEAMLKYYWDSPDFIYVNADGTTIEQKDLKKTFEEVYKTFGALKIITAREEYRILKKDIVLCLWLGKSEANMKDGSLITYNTDAVSFLFQKINEEWKVIYQSESSLPPVVQAANK